MVGGVPHSPLDLQGFGTMFSDEIKRGVKSWHGLKVLDVGTGSAGNAIFLAGLVGEAGKVYSVDPSREILERAAQIIEKKGFSKRIKLVEGKAENLPLDDSSFNMIVTLMALHHLEDIDKAFQEFNRVMNKDGTYLAIEWSVKASAFIPHPAADFLSLEQVRSKLRAHGFDITDSNQSEYYFSVKSKKKA